MLLPQMQAVSRHKMASVNGMHAYMARVSGVCCLPACLFTRWQKASHCLDYDKLAIWIYFAMWLCMFFHLIVFFVRCFVADAVRCCAVFPFPISPEEILVATTSHACATEFGALYEFKNESRIMSQGCWSHVFGWFFRMIEFWRIAQNIQKGEGGTGDRGRRKDRQMLFKNQKEKKKLQK